MSKSVSPRPLWGGDAHRHLARAEAVCLLRGCSTKTFAGLPVCFPHGIYISSHMDDALAAMGALPVPEPPMDPPPVTEWVYYLMVAPSTVKIGTTRAFAQRINGLRTEVQYVVAIERGGRDVERKRHQQFACDRIGRRENFKLSDRLKQHIESLQPDRDQLVSEALAG